MMRKAAVNAWFAVRRGAAVFLLAILTIESCVSWATQQGPVTEVVEARSPSTVRVTTADGEVWQVMRPRIVGDSLQGTTPDNLAVSIAVARIAKVDARQISPGRTELLVLGLGLGAIFGRF